MAHGVALYGGLVLYKAPIKPFDETVIVPVELVAVADVSNVRATIKPPKPEPIKEPEPEPEPMTLETPMVNAEAKGDLQERVEEVVEPEPEPVKVAEALPDPEEPPEEIIPPETPEPPKEPQVVDLDKLAGLVNRVREQAPEKNQQKTLQSETNNYVFADTAQAGIGEGTQMTLSELDALQSAMYKCWSIPAAAPNPEELIVPVKVSLFLDGYVEQVKLGSFKRLNHFHELAADEALRAVQKCQPYDFLPEEKYSQWREMTLNFRPDV